MKVVMMSYWDNAGGAARSTHRLHTSLRAAGVDSSLWVERAELDSPGVRVRNDTLSQLKRTLRFRAERALMGLQTTDNAVIHSPALLPSRYPKELNRSDADIVHLHWTAAGMLSIKDLPRIRKPVVWTLHDMWAFCGAEHVAEDNRWREGYFRSNRPENQSGLDLNRWTWNRKRRAWKRPCRIVAPSRWLADCVRQSALMNDWPVSVIPNPLDTDEWRPVEKAVARRLLGLPDDVPTILYGASGGWSEPGKGFDLLEASLRHLDVDRTDALLLVSGKGAPPATEVGGVKVRYTGFLHDAIALRIFYSAADVLAVPSRIESFGQVATEAHACGTPVVAFDNSGLSDVVTHERNGYLAHAFDVRDFARGLSLILARGEHAKEMGANARADAISRFSYPVVARAYLDVYTESLSDGRIESPR